MQTRIIQIGISKYVRLPDTLIKQYNLKEDIEITATPDGILIQPRQKKGPRDGWAEQIKMVIEKYGPEDVDKDWNSLSTEWEKSEWVW